MRLNDMTCLNYEVDKDKAVITLAGTDMDAIRALPEQEELMLYDGVGNPLLSLCGFDRIISIRILIDSDASEVTFGHTDTVIQEIRSRIGELEDSVPDLQAASDLSAIAFVCLAQSEALDDTTIIEHPDAFPVWDENWTGKRGSIVLYEGVLYRSIHDVGAGQNTNPAETPSMWTRIGDAGEQYHEWRQPIGAHDAYALGDIVIYNGTYYVSTVDNNIWQPGVYGWEETEV